MKSLTRVWREIRSGENIDLYLTVLLALVIAILNLFGLGGEYTTPLTLAVLALLAISILTSRHQSEDLAREISKTAQGLFRHEYPPSFDDEFAKADEVWLVGVSLSSMVENYLSTIESKLRRGHRIRVLMVQPGSHALQLSEMRALSPSSPERIDNETRYRLDDFCDLKMRTSGDPEICTINHPLGHGTIALNPDAYTGVMYISNYPFQTPGGALPKYMLRPEDGEWYRLYHDELTYLWKAGEPWECNGKFLQTIEESERPRD